MGSDQGFRGVAEQHHEAAPGVDARAPPTVDAMAGQLQHQELLPTPPTNQSASVRAPNEAMETFSYQESAIDLVGLQARPSSAGSMRPTTFNASTVYPADILQGQMPTIDMFADTNFLGMRSGTRTPRGLMDFGIETNLELDDLDFSFLETYNNQIPFHFSSIGDSLPQHLEDVEYVHSPVNGIIPAAKTLQKSIWRFVPAPQDHGAAEQHNLSLPATENDHDSPESRINLDRRTTTEKLDQMSRDRIFGIVLSMCKPSGSRTFSSFPSTELLDSLIQYFLTSPLSEADTWIHVPSFRPRTKRPELLTALAAAGAVLTPDPSLRKLGFAIQEIVRLHIPTLWEGDNTEIRNLELAQGFMLQLEIGLWSGNSRKIEIAESFQQPLLTMLRRGGSLRRSSYPLINVQPDDDGPELEKKWAAWIEQESYKRLIFHLFQHDAQSSMALLVSPLFSYAEVSLPLPESRNLWMAANANEWKSLYLASTNNISGRIPSVVDCIHDLELLERFSQFIDEKASNTAFLHAAWGLVWEYRQLSSILHGESRQWDSTLVMTSRYRELMKLLQCFRMESPGCSSLLLELILMHLHMSLEDVQLLAGLEGQEEASRVYPSLCEWVKTTASYQAVWHAGQVLRAAKSLPFHHLRDFSAIAVYHASLAFWAYSHALEKEPQPPSLTVTPTMQGSMQGQFVWLDEGETTDVQRFIALKRGFPCLRGLQPSSPPVPLKDASAVMDIVLGVLYQNHAEADRPMPPLVENLIRMMEGLRDTVRSNDG